MISYQWSGWKKAGIAWLLLISILFFLPGSAFPKENWLSAIHFDKIVHIGLFAVLNFLWRFYFKTDQKFHLLLLLLCLFYGTSVEFIQENFVPNRSFDIWDITSDMAGVLIGQFAWWWGNKKNRPL